MATSKQKKCAQECSNSTASTYRLKKKIKKYVAGESESWRCIKDFIKTRLFLYGKQRMNSHFYYARDGCVE